MASFEPLSSLDAMFLDLEDGAAHMHVGAVTIYAGRAPRRAALAAAIAARLDRMPRYRQRLAEVPLGLGLPVWVDAAAFDVDAHVHHATLPAPGGDAALRGLVGRLFSLPLDRARPLWDVWLVDGLGEDRFAIVWKTHHCMIDGASGVDLAAELHDATADAAPSPPAAPWAPRPAPGGARLASAALRARALAPLALARSALRRESPGALLELAAAVAPLARLSMTGPAPASSLNAPIGPLRRWETASIALADVKRIRAALGGTVNDVLLAALAGGLRELLAARGERPRGELRAFVPVDVRAPEARGTYGNQVSGLYCPLPVGEPDPVARLRAVTRATRRAKEGGDERAMRALVRLRALTLPAVAALAARAVVRGRWFNVVATNVRGPQHPLFLLGRRLVDYAPMVPLAAGQTIGVAFASYDGAIGVGLLGDAERAPDLPVLANAIPGAIRELLERAEAAPDAGRAAAR